MRVICLVPSWTETLIEAGVEVCGRTRFCIHPKDKVAGIPIVGGTKEVDWEKIQALVPDLIILDKEENPKEFAEKSPFPCWVTHVTDLESARDEMYRLGEVLKNQKILKWASQWNQLLSRPCGLWNWQEVPGEIKKLESVNEDLQKIVYVIWKNPWMAVNHKTFIAAVLKFLNAPLAELSSEKKYPEISEDFLKKHQILFSSEPYPFHKKEKTLIAAGFIGRIVNGESYSWFGLRSLNFLREAQRKSWEPKA